jgi:hypothetical protein
VHAESKLLPACERMRREQNRLAAAVHGYSAPFREKAERPWHQHQSLCGMTVLVCKGRVMQTSMLILGSVVYKQYPHNVRMSCHQLQEVTLQPIRHETAVRCNAQLLRRGQRVPGHDTRALCAMTQTRRPYNGEGKAGSQCPIHTLGTCHCCLLGCTQPQGDQHPPVMSNIFCAENSITCRCRRPPLRMRIYAVIQE